MALSDDLASDVNIILRQTWDARDGQVVPKTEDVLLAGGAVELNATVLYADLADSTALVNAESPTFSAEVYKTFLRCAARLITYEGGVITAYDGDRVMGVFIGNAKNTTAARTALKIHYAVRDIIRPAQASMYASKSYILRHVVGIDTSDLFIARTGVRGA